MDAQRFEQIRALMGRFNNLPDGAFLGVLEEHGVDVDEIAAYSKEDDRRRAATGATQPKHAKRRKHRRSRRRAK